MDLFTKYSPGYYKIIYEGKKDIATYDGKYWWMFNSPFSFEEDELEILEMIEL